MDTLLEIYTTLRGIGRCKSQEDFSRNYLGRSSSYFAHLRSSGQTCSLTSLQLLSLRLKAELVASEELETADRRKLGSAWVAATTMFTGEMELRYARPQDRVTAIVLPQWDDVRDH